VRTHHSKLDIYTAAFIFYFCYTIKKRSTQRQDTGCLSILYSVIYRFLYLTYIQHIVMLQLAMYCALNRVECCAADVTGLNVKSDMFQSLKLDILTVMDRHRVGQRDT
jgi:hypothetical protein